MSKKNWRMSFSA